MIKSIKCSLILFFMGWMLGAVALKPKASDSSIQQKEKTLQSDKQAQQSNSSKAQDKETTKTAEAQIKETTKTAEKEKDKNKRQVAGTAYQCSETWTDEFSFGYIQVGTKCDPSETLCLAHFHIARNYCEKQSLVRHYCDPKKPGLVSTEKIKCEKSCEFSGLSGVCVK